MTDNEIVETLKLCTTQDGSIPCYDCPRWNDDEQECEGIDYTATLDLINRQKTEIEKLKRKNEILSHNADNAFQEGLNECRELFEPEIKSEAYKEFAERLKRSTVTAVIGNGIYAVATSKGVDNLLKEMVGEENDA